MTAVTNLTQFNMNGAGNGMMRPSIPNVTLTIQPSTSISLPTSSAPRTISLGHRFQNYSQPDVMGDGPGRRLRKNVANVRRHVDYVSTVLNHCENRLWQYGKQRVLQQPDILYQPSNLPADSFPDVPVDCILTKFTRTAMNKVKCPVYSVCWSPEGKRLITGCQTGEFTLWNGTAFNFETILQAHDSAIRALKWASNEQWLLSADQGGFVKYWQPNMNNAHMFSAHKDDAIRGLAFAPTDVKFATASDDGTARVWDFARYTEERCLRGHGAEVRCIDWHPTKGLLVTGSRDTQQPVKIWDPKTGSCLATLQEHKSSVMAVEFNRNGNWLLTGGRDHLVKMYDIRMMKEMKTYRAHKKEVISLAWHPIHEGLFVSGGGDGSIVYWMVDGEKEIGLLEHAHDQAIWSMKWHPLGHILATGSNDNNTKFWARNRPGDTVEDIFGLSNATMVGHLDKEREPRMNMAMKPNQEIPEAIHSDTYIPGMGLDENLYEQLTRDGNMTMDQTLLVPDDMSRQTLAPMIGAKRTLIKQPPAKKAQRQFERMWNNSNKGISAGTDDFSAVIGGQGREDVASGGPPTQSFLGPPTTGGSLLGPSQPPEFNGPPSGPPPGPPAPWRPPPGPPGGPPGHYGRPGWNPPPSRQQGFGGGGGPPQRPPPYGNFGPGPGGPGGPGPGSYPPPRIQNQGPPPLPQQQQQPSGDVDYRSGPPSNPQTSGSGGFFGGPPPPSKGPSIPFGGPPGGPHGFNPSSFGGPPPPKSGDVDLRQMPPPPPQQQQRDQDSWRGGPPTQQNQQNDPRRDPRIARQQEQQMSPTGGGPSQSNQWMPQFDRNGGGGGPQRGMGRGRGRGQQPY